MKKQEDKSGQQTCEALCLISTKRVEQHVVQFHVFQTADSRNVRFAVTNVFRLSSHFQPATYNLERTLLCH